jgi:hypothetical protein
LLSRVNGTWASGVTHTGLFQLLLFVIQRTIFLLLNVAMENGKDGGNSLEEKWRQMRHQKML